MKKRLKPSPPPPPTRAERAAARLSRRPVDPVLTWLYNHVQEEGWGGDECKSRDEAIARAREAYGAGASFYIGKKGMPMRINADVVNADWVIEGIQERLHEQAGDVAAEAFDPTTEQSADLEKRLEETVRVWLRKHKLDSIAYYLVDEVEFVQPLNDDAHTGPATATLKL